MGLDLRVLTDEFKQALGSIEENLTPAVSAGRVIACAVGGVSVQGLPAVRGGELIRRGEHAHARMRFRREILRAAPEKSSVFPAGIRCSAA